MDFQRILRVNPIHNVEKLHTSAVLVSHFARPDTEVQSAFFFFANFADGRVCNLGQNEFIKVVS